MHRGQNNLQKSVLHFCPVGSWESSSGHQAKVNGKSLYLPNHPTDPHVNSSKEKTELQCPFIHRSSSAFPFEILNVYFIKWIPFLE